jgi:hypothetical protein
VDVTPQTGKRSVLVSLGDARHVDAVKQVFAGAHLHGGWNGDYLLAHDVPEPDLAWFESRGVHVRRCHGFAEFGMQLGTPQSNKFYLFTPEVRRWDRVVYFDADVIVRGSLERLTGVERFAACFDLGSPRLVHQLTRPQYAFYRPRRIPRIRRRMAPEAWRRIRRDYDLRARCFNGGVFAFPSAIVDERLVAALRDLLERYWPSVERGYSDQAVLNLLFYRAWEPLPLAYDLFPHFVARFIAGTEPQRMDAVVFHCPTVKPWSLDNAFHDEWADNLRRADEIDLGRPRPPRRTWTAAELARHDAWLLRRWRWGRPRYLLVYRFLNPLLHRLTQRLRAVRP